MKKIVKKTPYNKAMIWIQIGTGLMILAIHLCIYAISISENPRAKVATQNAANLMSQIMPRAIDYERQNRPHHIPFLQVLTSLMCTMPLGFFALKKVAQHDVNLIESIDGVFNFKVVWAFMLVAGVVILLTPPLGLGGMPDRTFYGILAPFKYAVTVFVIGYSVRVVITSKQDNTRNA